MASGIMTSPLGDGRFAPSITELIATFRSGLVALVPVADRAQMSWRDEDSHIDWEKIAESLYEAFVSNPISLDTALKGRVPKPLVRYDYNIVSYVNNSWIDVDLYDNRCWAFVRLISNDEPFDGVWVVEVDPQSGKSGPGQALEWNNLSFRLFRRFDDGSVEMTTEVAPAE